MDSNLIDSLYTRTIVNGGGTFTRDGQDVTHGYAVGIVDGTYASCRARDIVSFDDAVRRVIRNYPFAYIGTWLDGDTIHVDPAMVVVNEAEALRLARRNHQLAYYIIHEQREVRL
jgi:hypothetical protein